MVTRRERDRMRRVAMAMADNSVGVALGFETYLSLVRKLTPVSGERELALREAFRAGASFEFGAMMLALEGGSLETEDDMRRMDNLHREAMAIDDELRLKYGPPEGTA
jgi:hypothetical protein